MELRRSRDRVVAGVCGGLARELDVEPMVLRTLYTASLVFFGLGIPLYLVLYFLMEPSLDAAHASEPQEAMA